MVLYLVMYLVLQLARDLLMMWLVELLAKQQLPSLSIFVHEESKKRHKKTNVQRLFRLRIRREKSIAFLKYIFFFSSLHMHRQHTLRAHFWLQMNTAIVGVLCKKSKEIDLFFRRTKSTEYKIHLCVMQATL